MLNAVFKTKKPFVGFVTGGDGGKDYCIDCCLQLIEGGVDMLEIGMPFSDPIADGPVIQAASHRALESGTNSSTLLEIASAIRKKTTTPLVLFSYYNPLLQKGEAYLKEAKQAGFDAVLVVDLPVFLEPDTYSYFDAIQSAGMTPIFLASPSTDVTRFKQVVKEADGFIYYVCQKGTTGVKSTLPTDFAYHINRLKAVTSLPIVVGFGIADRENASAVLEHADGFVVGSAFVKLMAQKADPKELKKLAQVIDPR